MLTIENLVKRYKGGKGETDGVYAVNDVSLQVQEGELFTLLGPSGCGKTTTLRSVAGLEQPTAGVIRVGETVLFDGARDLNVPPAKRGLGMVFQSYAIWPHLNVFKNAAFPLTVLPRSKRPNKKEIIDRVDRVLGVVRLDHLRDRQATDLSGGQQQRLALARALVMEPPLLLLDEPLSNLDAKLREEMRFELKRLQRQLGITAVYVTHDQVEALAMSSKIAVMNGGKVEQLGTPREVYNDPKSLFVADFIGTSNFISGTVEEVLPNQEFLVSTAAGKLRIGSGAPFIVGAPVEVSIRPEHVGIDERPPTDGVLGSWAGSVQARAFLGDAVEHQVAVGDLVLRARANPSKSIAPDSTVAVTIPQEWCSLIPGVEK
jgi:iron(III) transport system ATP-binding protein